MRSSSCFRSLVLGFLLLFVLSCGESGTGGTNGLNVAGDETSNVEKSIVTITVGSDGQTASMKVAKNDLFSKVASAGFSLRNILRNNGEAVAAIPASVSTISFTISASNMTTITRDVTISGQSSITESFTVPNGNDRNFLVQAKNSSGIVIYKGDTTVTLSGATATLNIAMQANTTLGWSLLGTPLTITGKVTTVAGVAGYTGSAAGSRVLSRFNYPHGITTDGTNLYVMDYNNHTIRKIVISTGVVTLIGGYPGASGYTDGTDINARFYNPSDGVIVGTNLYVTDYGNHTIRKIDLTTNSVTTFAGTAGFYGSTDATGTSARFYNPRCITTDGTNLYVTDYNNHTIRKIEISTAIVTTLAGTALSYGSTDATGTSARFYNPAGITRDGTNLYVTDYGNHTIRKIDLTTNSVTTFAGTAGACCDTDATGTAARFYGPAGITSDGTNLYVTNQYRHTIRKIILSTGAVTTIAGTVASSGSTDGTGTAARFYQPAGITSDGTNLYVADYTNHTIRKIVISTAVVTTLTGMAGSTGSNNDTFTSATFFTPLGITSDGANLYIADRNNGAIRKIILSTGDVGTIATGFTYLTDITTDGTNLFVTEGQGVGYAYNQIKKVVISTGAVTTLAGSTNIGSTDGTGTAARFHYPYGITTDGTNLYVVDRGNHKIRKVVIASGVVTTLAGSGTAGSADGTGTAASFNDPIRITTDGTNLYVSDYGNHTIRKIVISTAVVTTLAGTAGSAGSTDGTGSAARFNGPAGITTDSSYLYVTEESNDTIRAINLTDNSVITVTGYPGSAGYFDWTGLPARFNNPFGIATDGTYLYVTETNNHTIRRIQ